MTDIKELQKKFCEETGWKYFGEGVLGVKGDDSCSNYCKLRLVPPPSMERVIEFVPLAEAFLNEYAACMTCGLKEALEKDVSLYHMRKILMVFGFKLETEERK